MVFILRAQPHAQSLFLYPIHAGCGINLIHFFDEKKDGAAEQSIVCLPFDRSKRRTRTVSKSATFLATESVNSAPFKRGETKVQILARKSAKLFANTKMEIFGKGKVQNSSPISAFGKERCKIHRQFLRY